MAPETISYSAPQLWNLVPTDIKRCSVSINIQRENKVMVL